MPPSLVAEFGEGTRWGNGFSFSGNLGMNAKGELAFSTLIFRGSDYLGSYLLAAPPEAPRVAARFVEPDSTDEGFFAAGI